jgi:aminopeptidase N
MEWWTHLWLNEGFATWVKLLNYSKSENEIPQVTKFKKKIPQVTNMR